MQALGGVSGIVSGGAAASAAAGLTLLVGGPALLAAVTAVGVGFVVGNLVEDTVEAVAQAYIESPSIVAQIEELTQSEEFSILEKLLEGDLFVGVWFVEVLSGTRCFPAHTQITLADHTTKPISEITIGDRVLSHDKDGNLVESIVDKLFRNTTQEWINLSFDDGRDDLVATPGHRFLTETGDFMEIGHMVRLGGGSVRLVEKDGSIVEAKGELISYSAETAHMFEEAQSRATIFDGNLAVKHDAEAGWATYNFEVRDTHTYIANDIRVHNDSILSFLQEGDTVYALNDDLTDLAVARDVNGDGINEIVLLDGERFVDVNGGDTFLEVEQTFIPDDPSADVEALLAQFIENNPEAASNIYDPGNGNVPMDGIPSDDIVEILTDDIGGTFSSRRFGGVEVPTLDALVLAAVTGGAGALIGTLFAPLEGTTTDLGYASGDGDVSITPTGPDATAVLLFILGLDASAEIVPGIPDPFGGGSIGGITLGTLIGGLDLPELGSFDVNFGAGIAQGDVVQSQVGDDLVLTIDNGDGTTNTMTLAGVYADGNADEINSITFADGTSVDLSEIEMAMMGDGIVNGTEFADIIDLMSGDAGDGDMVTDGADTINGLGGDDLIMGADGNDTIDGGLGSDEIEGGRGDDILRGGDGDDVLQGNSGADTLYGGEGNDTINGGRGGDTAYGEAGDDFLYGSFGTDTVFGGDGNDLVRGNNLDDEIDGGAGNDVLFGGTENDTIVGGADNDFLYGDEGTDTLTGGTGNDVLWGGSSGVISGDGSSDVFIFETSGGFDQIRDFEAGTDVIDLSAFEIADFASLQSMASDRTSGVRLDLDDGSVVFVHNQTVADLSEDDFILNSNDVMIG